MQHQYQQPKPYKFPQQIPQTKPPQQNTSHISSHYQTFLIPQNIISKFYQKLIYGTIIFCLIYSIPTIVLNFICTQNQQNNEFYQLISNQFTKLIYQMSNYRSICNCEINLAIQTIVYIITILLFYLFLISFQVFIKYLYSKHKKQKASIENYGILLTSKFKLSSKQKTDVKQYIQNFIQVCLKQKLNQFIAQERESMNQSETVAKNRTKNIHFIKQVCLKSQLIQKIIFLNNPVVKNIKSPSFMNKSIKQNSIYTTKKLIVLFSYQFIPQLILNYWNNQPGLRQTVKKDIQSIAKLYHPRDLIYANINEKGTSEQRFENYRFSVLLFVLVELGYIGLIIFAVESIFMQKDIYPQSIIQSFSSGLAYMSMALFGLLLFLLQQFLLNPNRTLFQQIIVYNKKYQTKQQILKTIQKTDIVLKFINLLLIPILSVFIIICRKNGIQSSSMTMTIKLTLFGEYGLNTIIIYYLFIKYVLKNLFQLLIQRITCNNSNKNVQQLTIQPPQPTNAPTSSTSQWEQHILREYQSFNSINYINKDIISFFLVTVFFCILINSGFFILGVVGLIFELCIINKSKTTMYKKLKMSTGLSLKYLYYLLSTIKKIFIFTISISLFAVQIFAYFNSIFSIFFFLITIAILALIILIDSLIFKTVDLDIIQRHSTQNYWLNSKPLLKLSKKLFKTQNQTANKYINEEDQIEELNYEFNNNNQSSLFTNANKNDNSNKERKFGSTNKKVLEKLNCIRPYAYQSKFFQHDYEFQIQKSFNPALLTPMNVLEPNKKNHAHFGNHNNQQHSKAKIIQQLNTMTQTIQQTLKQKLLKNHTNPFNIGLTAPLSDDLSDFDFQFQQKIKMKTITPKVKIPQLFKPQDKSVLIKSSLNKNTDNIYMKRDIEKKPQENKQQSSPNKQFSSPENSNFLTVKNARKLSVGSSNNNQSKNNRSKRKSITGSDLQYDIPSSYNQKSSQQYYQSSKSSKSWNRLKRLSLQSCDIPQQIPQQRQSVGSTPQAKPMIKLAKLFDEDQESMKHLVRKKIKQSIRKLEY